MIKFLKSFFGGKSAEPEVAAPVAKVEAVNNQPVVKEEAAPAVKKPAAVKAKPVAAKKPAAKKPAAKAPAKKPAAKKASAKKAK